MAVHGRRAANRPNVYNDRDDSFTSFLNDPEDPGTLSNNYVRAIVEDDAHNLWIGTVYGLNRFNRKDSSFTRFLHVPGKPSSLSGNMIHCMLVDHLGKLWVGTNMGLDIYNEKEGTFTSYTLIYNGFIYPITTLFEDRHGRIWVGAGSAGIFRFDRRTETFHRISIDRFFPVALPEIKTIREDPQGMLWIGSSEGLIRYDPETGGIILLHHEAFNEHSLPDNDIRDLYIQDNGFIWIGTGSGGVSLVNPKKSRFHHMKIPFTTDGSFPNNSHEDDSGTGTRTDSGGFWDRNPSTIFS
jgi:ligand-binding sensor domain-containing protein